MSAASSSPTGPQSPVLGSTAGLAEENAENNAADRGASSGSANGMALQTAPTDVDATPLPDNAATDDSTDAAPLPMESGVWTTRGKTVPESSIADGEQASLSPTAAAKVAAVVAAAAARMGSGNADVGNGNSADISTDSTTSPVLAPISPMAPIASTSKITLEDLRRRRIQNRQQKLETLVKHHDQELREIFFMMRRQNKLESEGSPAIPAADDRFVMDDIDERELVAFLSEYALSSEVNTKSISELRLAPLNDTRDAIIRDEPGLRKMSLPTRPRPASQPLKHENKAMPPPTAASDKVEAERVRRASLQSSRPLVAGVPLAGPQTSMTESQKAPLPAASGAQSLTDERATALAAEADGRSMRGGEKMEASGEDSTKMSLDQLQAGHANRKDSPTGVPPAISGEAVTTAAGVVVESQGLANSGVEEDSVKAKEMEGEDAKETSKRPRLLKINPPPSPIPSQQLLGKSDSDTPLHPTLQVLSPNPLSVTYASSLRPLPSDPFRRFTGTGVGGGSIHHRSHRRAAQLPPKNGVPPPSGPVGAGGVDLYRWYVRARASPGAGLVGKADKCLLTTDWKAAFDEQRFIRAMDRIEKLKSEGLWSFRQIKKQKGPVVRKAHWDHLLDEVRWMQVDFREERRWKIALAFHLASMCKALVKAKTPQARARLCIKARKPHFIDDEHRFPSDTESRTDLRVPQNGAEDASPLDVEMLGEDIRRDVKEEVLTDDEESSAREAQESVYRRASSEDIDVDAKGVDALAVEANDIDDNIDVDEDGTDADGDMEEDEDAQGEDDIDADGENDDGEVEAATRAFNASNEDSAIPVEIVNEEREPAQMPELSASDQDQGLNSKPSSSAIDAQGVRSEAQSHDATLADAHELPINVLSAIRAPIFSMDSAATTISPSTLLQYCDAGAIAEMLGIPVEELSDKLDLDHLSISVLFPELPIFDTPKTPDETGKGERRWDDGSLNLPPRLTHVSRLMDSKPLLVSALNPAKNRVQGRWKDDSDWKIAAELADPTKGVSPEELDAPPIRGSVLFARKSHKNTRDSTHGSSGNIAPPAPVNADARAASLLWTSEEDDFLLLLIKQYGAHWQLISDLFNATRLSVPTDVREAWDCFDRYQRIQQAASEGKSAPASSLVADRHGEGALNAQQAAAQALQANMPSNSLALKHERLTKKIGLKYDGSRKKLRRVNITEAMKRSAKRRETAQRAQNQPKRVNLQSHETHNQIKTPVVPTPQQLSMMKAERDEALKRQQEMMIQQQRMQQQQQLQQAQAQAQAQQVQSQAAAQAQSQGQGQLPASQSLPAGSPPQGAQQQGQPLTQQQLAAQQRQHQQQLQAQQQRLLQQLQQQPQMQGRPAQGMPQKQAFPAAQQQPGQMGQPSPRSQHQQRPGSAQPQQPRPHQQQFQRPSPQMQQQQARPDPSPQPQLPLGQQSQNGTPRPAPATPAGSLPGQAQQQGLVLPPGNVPAQLQAIQQSLLQNQNLTSSMSPEALQMIALQLYRQAQQGGFGNALANLQQLQQQRPPGQQGARPMSAPQQQSGQQARPSPQQQARPQTPRPGAASTPQSSASPRPPSQGRSQKQQQGRASSQQGTNTASGGGTAGASTPKGGTGKGSNASTPASTPRKA